MAPLRRPRREAQRFNRGQIRSGACRGCRTFDPARPAGTADGGNRTVFDESRCSLVSSVYIPLLEYRVAASQVEETLHTYINVAK